MTRFSILALLLVAVPAAAQSGVDDAKPIFLVTDVTVGDGVTGIDSEAARNVLATRFGRLKDKLEVRSMTEAKASIDQAALAQMMGSGDDSTMAQVEKYIQVDRLVFGRITNIAGVTDIQVKVFNVREGVTEVGFARRLKAGSEPSMVLSMLDRLADSLLAWTINTYTDGAQSSAATALASKKLGGKKPAVAEAPAPAPASGGRFSWLGTVGGLGLGAGLGAGGIGVYGALVDGDASATDIAVIGASAVVAAVGAIAVGVDVITE